MSGSAGIFGSVEVTGLDASKAVVTDGSKILASLAYATAATASTLVERDASGNVSVVGLNASALDASKAVVTDGSKNLASLAYATADTASTLVERNSASRIACQGIITSGGAPSLTDLSGTFGTGSSLSLEAGSTDFAGCIEINTGTGPSYYGQIKLTYANSIGSSNRPTVLLILENAGSSWGAGASINLSNVILLVSNTTDFQFQVLNAHGNSGTVNTVNFAASGSVAYRIRYLVMVK